MRSILPSLSAAALLLAATAAPVAAHPGADQVGPGYFIQQHHRDVLVIETNNLATNGLHSYFGNVRGDTGAQLHDACVMPGWAVGRGGGYDAIYRGDVFYNYVIAQRLTVGADDTNQVADALGFWLAQDNPAVPRNSHGSPDWTNYSFSAACAAAGGAFHEADLVVFTDENLGGAMAQNLLGAPPHDLADPFPPSTKVPALPPLP